MQSVVVAKVTIQHQVGHREYRGNQLEQGSQHSFDPHKLRGERNGSLGMVGAALWTARTTRGTWPFGRLGGCFGLAGSLFRVAAHDLLDAHRKRPPFLDTH